MPLSTMHAARHRAHIYARYAVGVFIALTVAISTVTIAAAAVHAAPSEDAAAAERALADTLDGRLAVHLQR